MISFDVAPGYSLGSAVNAVRQAETDVGLPASVSTQFEGSALAFQSALANELLLILAAIVTVYIVLGVLYESFIHPVTILSTLPSAGVGALLALIITGHDLNIVSIIGIILLIGIVKKNAIMMIDFALEAERNEGKSRARGDPSGGAAALPAHPDDDGGRAVRRAAADDGQRHGLGTAPSAGHLHCRRPAGQPAPDPVHDARDLHLFRPAGGAVPATVAGCCRSRHESFRGLHPPPDRHHAADDGPGDGRGGGLFPAAGRAAAQRRHADDHGDGRMPGASPETMSTSVATPLERHLGVIAAV